MSTLRAGANLYSVFFQLVCICSFFLEMNKVCILCFSYPSWLSCSNQLTTAHNIVADQVRLKFSGEQVSLLITWWGGGGAEGFVYLESISEHFAQRQVQSIVFVVHPITQQRENSTKVNKGSDCGHKGEQLFPPQGRYRGLEAQLFRHDVLPKRWCHQSLHSNMFWSWLTIGRYWLVGHMSSEHVIIKPCRYSRWNITITMNSPKMVLMPQSCDQPVTPTGK